MSGVLLIGWWKEDLLPLMHITDDLRMANERVYILTSPQLCLRMFSLVRKQISQTLVNVVASLPVSPEADRTSTMISSTILV